MSAATEIWNASRRAPMPVTSAVPGNAGRVGWSPWRMVLFHALLGGLFGYAVLHPASMLIFRFLDPMRSAASPPNESFLAPVAHSFRLDMLPMGLVFATFSSLIAAMNGYHRATLAAHRARLSNYADLLETQNERLVGLEKANRRATRFLVHDLKHHLGSILGFTDLMLARDDLRHDERVADALTRIRRQGSWMLQAVRSLLDLDRLREGVALRQESLPVKNLLEDTLIDHGLLGANASLRLGNGMESCPDVLADPGVIGRVLANLVTNALKHNKRQVEVVLDAYQDGDRCEVIITCTDNGLGIPEELAPRLFSEFQVASGQPAGDSTGLGLAFCKEAVEAHGGRIWCEPSSGSGARFCFTLPVWKGEQPL